VSLSEFCRALLAALDAAEGRRRSRKRDQTPDAIGLGLKRALLERALREAPRDGTFEQWLLDQGATPTTLGVLEEWRLARAMPEFAEWLANGAPSDDAHPGGRRV